MWFVGSGSGSGSGMWFKGCDVAHDVSASLATVSGAAAEVCIAAPGATHHPGGRVIVASFDG